MERTRGRTSSKPVRCGEGAIHQQLIHLTSSVHVGIPKLRLYSCTVSKNGGYSYITGSKVRSLAYAVWRGVRSPPPPKRDATINALTPPL